MKKNKTNLYYVLIVVLFILICISSFFFNYFYNLRNSDLSIEEMSIKEKNQASYNVKLFDNNFFKSSLEDTNYVLSLIDNVNAYFNYTTTFSKSIKGEYSYYIVGKVVMSSNDEKVNTEIYKSDISKYEINGKAINLSESFNIDVDNIINEYKSQINNLDINVLATLEYDVIINYSVFSDDLNKSIVNSKTISYYIPINDITNITYTDDEIEERKEFSEINYEDNKIYLVICLEFIGAIIIFILLIVLIVKRVNESSSLFQNTLDKILTEYDKYIIYLKDIPDLSTYDILFISNMDRLVDVSKKLKSPITFFEVIKKKEATFMVLKDRKAYVYKISDKELK